MTLRRRVKRAEFMVEMVKNEDLLVRYQACALRIVELFDDFAVSRERRGHLIDRLETLLERGLLVAKVEEMEQK